MAVALYSGVPASYERDVISDDGASVTHEMDHEVAA